MRVEIGIVVDEGFVKMVRDQLRKRLAVFGHLVVAFVTLACAVGAVEAIDAAYLDQVPSAEATEIVNWFNHALKVDFFYCVLAMAVILIDIAYHFAEHAHERYRSEIAATVQYMLWLGLRYPCQKLLIWLHQFYDVRILQKAEKVVLCLSYFVVGFALVSLILTIVQMTKFERALTPVGKIEEQNM